MPKIAMSVIRSEQRKRIVARAGAARDEVIAAVKNEVAQDAIGMAEDIVSNWKHKPQFKTRVTVTRDAVTLYVYPIGENAKYWEWTSLGTKPHIITVKRAKYLRFRSGYVPKTTPRPTWGGPGVARGKWNFRKYVNHPGTEPRDFEAHIGKQIRAQFRRDIENAFRRGARK